MLRFDTHAQSSSRRNPGLPVVAALLGALAVAAASSTPAISAEHFFVDNCLPPENSQYVAMLHQQYAAGQINLADPIHYRFTRCDPPPATTGGQTIHSMGSLLEFRMSFDGGATYQSMQAPGQMTVRVRNAATFGSQTFFETEMLQLDISGGSMPPGVRVRESPTRASTGRTTIRPAPGGYWIDSFFDVFTELSLDDGQTWMPSEGAGRVQMDVLNPTPSKPSSWGRIKSLYYR